MQWLQFAFMLQDDPFNKTERGLLTSLTWEISPEKKYKQGEKKKTIWSLKTCLWVTSVYCSWYCTRVKMEPFRCILVQTSWPSSLLPSTNTSNKMILPFSILPPLYPLPPPVNKWRVHSTNQQIIKHVQNVPLRLSNNATPRFATGYNILQQTLGSCSERQWCEWILVQLLRLVLHL